MTDTNPRPAPSRRKWLRFLPLSLAVAVLLGFVLYWNRPEDKGFDRPGDCVESFYAASKDGQESAVKRCLSPALHGETAGLMAKKRDLKTWVIDQNEVKTGTGTASLDADEVRLGDTQRLRFHLEQTPRGWVITGIGSPVQVQGTIKYGTHLSEHPNP